MFFRERFYRESQLFNVHEFWSEEKSILKNSKNENH